MPLSTIIFPKKSKLTILAIKDRKKLFTGQLALKDTPRGPRPGRFMIGEEPRAPDEVIDLLRLADKIILINDGNETLSEFRNMLSAYQLSYEYAAACRFCLNSGIFSPVDASSIKYRNELICVPCAKKELLKETKLKKLGIEAYERMLALLLKIKDLDRVVGMMAPDKVGSEFTRFDTIRASAGGKTLNTARLKISDVLKSLLPEKLLPVQSMSMEAGLLEGKSQLIVSATATGKTLIGEMAGIENILNKKGKMLYLVPLVALANQKYDQFTRKYSPAGITTSIRVGTTRLKTKKTGGMRTALGSDIIVGTYEGLDYVIRSGKAGDLGKIGTVVIDEIHMLEDEDRGHRLDGLIARLKFISPGAQFVYLSATVGNPEWLGRKLAAQVIEYEERPVPLERHLIFAAEHEKLRLIESLSGLEYNKRSTKGYRGQTIVFTNSRRNCHKISEALQIKSAAYHAGLQYHERKRIEEQFLKGELPVVVTTAALAAGVDFPASQVIFHTLAMGIDWITVQEFHQMMGRAGRPDYHDRGIVVLLAEPGKSYQKGEAEDAVAFRLLRGMVERLKIDYDEEKQLEETLANITVAGSLSELDALEKSLICRGDTGYLSGKLLEYRFAARQNARIAPTEMGRIVAAHFLSAKEAFLIKDAIMGGKHPVDIFTDLYVFKDAYLRYAPQLSSALNMDIPQRVFHAASIDIVFSGDSLTKLEGHLREMVIEFARDFLTCKCRDSPYCGCPERKFSSKIIELRCSGLDPSEIIRELTATYGIYAYAGDLFNYLDQAVRTTEAIELIAGVLGKKQVADEARTLKRKIEGQ